MLFFYVYTNPHPWPLFCLPSAPGVRSPSSRHAPVSHSKFQLLPNPALTRLSATLTNHPTSVASKALTENLTPLEATLTKNKGVGVSSATPFPNNLSRTALYSDASLSLSFSYLYGLFFRRGFFGIQYLPRIQQFSHDFRSKHTPFSACSLESILCALFCTTPNTQAIYFHTHARSFHANGGVGGDPTFIVGLDQGQTMVRPWSIRHACVGLRGSFRLRAVQIRRGWTLEESKGLGFCVPRACLAVQVVPVLS